MGNFPNRSGTWKPGEVLSEEDRRLLIPLKRRARELGYTPTKKEVPQCGRIKTRFRTWEDAVQAAGLPPLKSAEQQQLRRQTRETQNQDAKIIIK